MDEKEWLGAENQLGIDIWKKKYCFENENFEEWITRISGGNQEAARLIKEKKFLFGGRILSNRGLQSHGKKISLSNCYVITPPEDNIESIFNCATKLARTYSYGGGCHGNGGCGRYGYGYNSGSAAAGSAGATSVGYGYRGGCRR